MNYIFHLLNPETSLPYYIEEEPDDYTYWEEKLKWEQGFRPDFDNQVYTNVTGRSVSSSSDFVIVELF